MMKRLALVLAVIVVTLVVGLAARPVLAGSIPEVEAMVTLKDFQFDFFTTTDNPVGVAVDPKGDIKVGILGLTTFTQLGLPDPENPRPFTPIITVTPEGRDNDFASLDLATDLQPCRDARPGRDFLPSGDQQEPTPFMTGLVYHWTGDLYVGLPNCDPDTHGIWRVKKNGKAEPFAQMPLSQLPKGLAFSKNDDFPLYVTDLHDFTHSRAECAARIGTDNPCTLKIWSIESDGTVTDPWSESALFYGDVNSPLLHPHGVNGIAVDKAGKNVYVTVTDHGRVIRIPVNRDGSAGEPKVIFESPQELPTAEGGNPLNQGKPRYWGMDDITIGPDGNFYIVIVRTDELVALPPHLKACKDSPPNPCNGDSIQVLHKGHPLDGPTQLTFGKSKHDGKGDKAGQPLPPLYITNGSGARIFFYNFALFLGSGLSGCPTTGDPFLDGITCLVTGEGIFPLFLPVRTSEQVVDLQPRPSLVRVLLGNGD